MSGYPPPPNPAGYPPGYEREAAKAQRRYLDAQRKAVERQQRQWARMQRTHMRAQSRMARRGSLLGPILLVALGVIFLLTQTGTLSWAQTLSWYGRWWPTVLIAAGLLLMAEWAITRQRQIPRSPYAGPVLGGGVVFLLILLAFLGWSLRYSENVSWGNHFFSGDWAYRVGEPHESDSALSSPLSAGEPLIVRCPRGDVAVTGSSQDGQVHVSVHKQVHAWKESDAERREREIEPAFSASGGQLLLEVPAQDGGRADLTIEVPHDAPITVQANHGDVTVSELHAPVTLSADRGNVEMNAVDGTVAVHVNDDDASINGHSISGSVSVQGRSGDINLSDVTGPLSLEGDFFGSTHLERVNGAVRFHTSRTQFDAARLDGDFEVDTSSDLRADQLVGPVTIQTRNRDIQLDRVSGHVQITNRNGAVTVTNVPPFAGIQIINQRGSVDVGVPTDASFVLNAQTRHGQIEDDFGLARTSSGENSTLTGTVGKGGPVIALTTSDGDITIHRSTAAPLPPLPPAPPVISRQPPAAPAVGVLPAAPGKPAKPAKKAVPFPATPAAPQQPGTPGAPASSPSKNAA